MKNYEEMTIKEQKEVIELFSNWLEPYCSDVINYVVKRKDEIITNDFAMNLLIELKEREEKEKKEFTHDIGNLFNFYNEYNEYDPHSHILTHGKSYRDVLYDMFIRDR